MLCRKAIGENMEDVHKELSVDCFNRCWTLMDKADRSAEDVENMVLLANASLWHWKQRKDSKPLNLSIGYWQVSRAYALAGDYEMAKFFGDRCLQVGQQHGLPAFYVGYAYEALARAELLKGRTAAGKELLAEARKRLNEVTDKEERNLLGSDLDSLEQA
jgi:hypothetical protein